MSYSLEITQDAHVEVDLAYKYYEGIRAGLGDDFLMSLVSQYGKVSLNPLIYSYIGRSELLRDVKIGRFPYVIVYMVVAEKVVVLSVRSTYRKPFIP